MLKRTFDQRLVGIPARVASDLPYELESEYEGLARLHLGHGKVGSVFFPQQIFINVGGWHFYQPSFFGPPRIGFDFSSGRHRAAFNVDVCSPTGSQAARLILEIASEDRVRSWPDGSQLYRCSIKGPRILVRHAAGRASPLDDGDFGLRLFHITTQASASAIRIAREIWGSGWNLQGTRRLSNVAYAYLTSMQNIQSEADLRRIAMSSDGRISFQTTSFANREAVLELPVYRERTTGRTASIPVLVASALVTPPNLLLHPPVKGPAYYEVVAPEIYRIGLAPGTVLGLKGEQLRASAEHPRPFSYVVLGDPSGVAGLAAPYHEDEAIDVMHLQELEANDDPFSFWQAHANTDLMTDRVFERRAFAVEDVNTAR